MTPLTGGERSPSSLSTSTGSSFLKSFRSNNRTNSVNNAGSRYNVQDQVKLGLHEVTENMSKPRATIIFVHGLGGHPIKTWSYQRNAAYVSIPSSISRGSHHKLTH